MYINVRRHIAALGVQCIFFAGAIWWHYIVVLV